MSFPDFQPSNFTLDDYALSAPPLSRSSSSAKSGFLDQWNGLGLHEQVIRNLDKVGLRPSPEELHKRIIRCVLLAHHLEVLVPPQNDTTGAIDAALVTFVVSQATSRFASHTCPSPLVLVVCMTAEKASRHSEVCASLSTDVQGFENQSIHHLNTLSADLAAFRKPVERPIVISTLARSRILLDHQALSLDQLSILVLDLRGPSQMTHHTVAELKPLLALLGSHVQIIILLPLLSRIHPALSDLVDQKMETSIRANLANPPPLCLSAASPSPPPTQTTSSAHVSPPANEPPSMIPIIRS